MDRGSIPWGHKQSDTTEQLTHTHIETISRAFLMAQQGKNPLANAGVEGLILAPCFPCMRVGGGAGSMPGLGTNTPHALQ